MQQSLPPAPFTGVGGGGLHLDSDGNVQYRSYEDEGRGPCAYSTPPSGIPYGPRARAEHAAFSMQ
eukprot:4547905-Lingulodinium_polyedra.AAC.1